MGHCSITFRIWTRSYLIEYLSCIGFWPLAPNLSILSYRCVWVMWYCKNDSNVFFTSNNNVDDSEKHSYSNLVHLILFEMRSRTIPWMGHSSDRNSIYFKNLGSNEDLVTIGRSTWSNIWNDLKTVLLFKRLLRDPRRVTLLLYSTHIMSLGSNKKYTVGHAGQLFCINI